MTDIIVTTYVSEDPPVYKIISTNGYTFASFETIEEANEFYLKNVANKDFYSIYEVKRITVVNE